jgi:hypothetical protein
MKLEARRSGRIVFYIEEFDFTAIIYIETVVSSKSRVDRAPTSANASGANMGRRVGTLPGSE